jgi:hypothetical protein
MSARDGLDLAIRAARSQTRLARGLQIAQSQICKWRKRGYVPIRRVPAVSAATGLPMHVIRPDLPDFFPHPIEQPEARDEPGRNHSHALSRDEIAADR